HPQTARGHVLREGPEHRCRWSRRGFQPAAAVLRAPSPVVEDRRARGARNRIPPMSPARWRNPVVKQWGLMLAALCTAVVACSLGGLFWRLDMSIYDAALPTGPAPTDVVIVAIDDA